MNANSVHSISNRTNLKHEYEKNYLKGFQVFGMKLSILLAAITGSVISLSDKQSNLFGWMFGSNYGAAGSMSSSSSYSKSYYGSSSSKTGSSNSSSYEDYKRKTDIPLSREEKARAEGAAAGAAAAVRAGRNPMMAGSRN